MKKIKYIIEWHEYVKNEPDKHCKAIHSLKAMIERLIAKDEIYYDENEIEVVIDFCGLLNHLEGEWAGKPLILNKVQKYIVACLYGIKEKNTKLRYFREAIMIVARKFGKSLFISALCLYGLIADGEQGAQIWALATVKSQAEIIYKNAVKLALKSPKLKKYLRTRKVSDGQVLEFEMTNSYMKAGGKNVETKDGLNVHVCAIDELHAIKNRNTYDVMISAMGARQQPLMLIITTSGFERDNIYDSIYNVCKRILSGEVDDNRKFPIIFEIDEEDDWKDEAKYIKANPGLGITPKIDYLIQQRNNAIADIALLPSFLCKHLNRASNASVIYFDLNEIDKCMEELNEDEYKNKYAVGGVDLAETTDLCNATCTIPVGGKFIVIQKYFVAEKRIEEMSAKDKKAYEFFKETKANDIGSKSILEITPGSFVKKEYVTNWFLWLMSDLGISLLRIGYDTWHSKDWADDMNSKGFTHCSTHKGELEGILLPVVQGMKTLSQPMKETKIAFKDKIIRYSKHNGLFRWCCNNTSAKIDVNNNIMPDKAHSTGRIDGYAGFLNSIVAYNSIKYIFDAYQP